MVDPIPEVFVLWHPSCSMGEFLATRIYAWLRPGQGLGPQVFYRSLPAPESVPGGLPPTLPGEIRSGSEVSTSKSRVSNLHIVLLLIDEHMIADASWRYWLSQLSSPPQAGDRLFLPVALDSTAYNINRPLRELNFLRPKGLPLPDDQDAATIAREIVVRSLLKQLTEALCKVLLGRRTQRDNTTSPGQLGAAEFDTSKIKVFLSHAKVDGTNPAKRIRDYIYSQTQLATFYDVNDIPFGSGFSRVIQQEINAGETAALIAVRSEAYAGRPWCRRELSLFRTPVQDLSALRVGEQWILNPVLVVDALDMDHRTVGIPELGNAPIIHWSEGVFDQEEHIVNMLMRDVMLAAYHTAVGRNIQAAPNSIVLNWLPDVPTLLRIPRVRERMASEVYYPGRGMSGLELDILDEYFPHLVFHSFDEVLS
jgi:hypothetical protein